MPSPAEEASNTSGTMTRPTPVVFLHAFPLDGTMWEDTAQRLRGRPVLRPSFPGFGGEPASAASLNEFAERIVEAMDRKGFDDAVLVGLSMGGYVSFRIMERWPERVRALVLADTKAGADSSEAAEKRTEQAARARREGIGWLADAMAPALLGETSLSSRPEVEARVRKTMEGADAEGVAKALEAMRERPDSTALLPQITVPVLAIVGAEDTVTPEAEAQRIAEGVPDGQLVVIPGAGHLSNLETPEAFGEALDAFLARIDAAGR